MSENSKDKSAIDAIYEILERISLIEQRLTQIEMNQKLTNNKFSKLTKEILNNEQQNEAKPSAAIPRATAELPKTASDLVIGNIKVFGKIVNKNRQPIPNVKINIYSESGKAIRTIDSDHTGYWEARLPAGHYGIEYVQQGFKPINKNISLDPTMKFLEVK